jgi:hypothetical protein
MEIIKSRYGLERSIEWIKSNQIRVMGESQFVRTSTTKDGTLTMFDFEGGPAYTVGGKIFFQKLNWKIQSIQKKDTKHKDLYECILDVTPIYY